MDSNDDDDDDDDDDDGYFFAVVRIMGSHARIRVCIGRQFPDYHHLIHKMRYCLAGRITP